MSSSFEVQPNNAELTSVRNGSGPNYGSGAVIENPDSSQIHVWGDHRDNVINLAFNNTVGFTKGHHARGENKTFTNGLSKDVFNFQDLDEIGSGSTVVGRIEDFDIDCAT